MKNDPCACHCHDVTGSTKQWTTLAEAQDSSHDSIPWWMFGGTSEGRVRGMDKEDSHGCLLCVETGMYVGERNASHGRNGYGVFYCKDGLLLVGTWQAGLLNGPGKQLYLSQSPAWLSDRSTHSPIQRMGEGVPYIYIGNYHEGLKEDPKARVILKDGTTRIGHWEKDKPVGNWWEDHEEFFTSSSEVNELIAWIKPQGIHPVLPSGVDCLSCCCTQAGSNTTTDGLGVSNERVNDKKRSSILKGKRSSPKTVTFFDGTMPFKGNFDDHEENSAAISVKPALAEVCLGSRATTGSMDSLYHAYHTGSVSSVFFPIKDEEPSVKWIESGFCGAASSESDEYHQHTQLEALWVWLCNNVIGYDACPTEMMFYASKLLEYGFHSPEMVYDYCLPDDIATFDWMKPIHKCVFLSKLPSEDDRFESEL